MWFRRVARRSLDKFQGLRRREFLEEGMLGSGWIFRVSRGKCGVVLLWEGRERVAGARARLGDQFRWILEVLPVFDFSGVMGRSSGFSGWISEEESGSRSPGIAL